MVFANPRGLWFVVCDLWFVVCNLWLLVCGLWFLSTLPACGVGRWGLGWAAYMGRNSGL
jgi:hypothetical protein